MNLIANQLDLQACNLVEQDHSYIVLTDTRVRHIIDHYSITVFPALPPSPLPAPPPSLTNKSRKF